LNFHVTTTPFIVIGLSALSVEGEGAHTLRPRHFIPALASISALSTEKLPFFVLHYISALRKLAIVW
jgi:hypothetical protein